MGYVLYNNIPIQEDKVRIAVDKTVQAEMTLLREKALKKELIKPYPFNPNFISDYKGYTLGMSTMEIDRLHDFRAKNTYVNTAKEFQEVTGVSDSLLETMTPSFKFPPKFKRNPQQVYKTNVEKEKNTKKPLGDLNLVSATDLKTVYGIGEKLSKRIVKFRDRLGGFLIDDQLHDVYGLSPEVVERTLQRFKVLNPPIVHKININSASAEELSKLIYIQRKVAIDIINYRNAQKSIKSFDELTKIEDFPINRIDRIKLYLSL